VGSVRDHVGLRRMAKGHETLERVTSWTDILDTNCTKRYSTDGRMFVVFESTVPDLRFSRQLLRRVLSSEICRRVLWQCADM
jgi:hypothetical protein